MEAQCSKDGYDPTSSPHAQVQPVATPLVQVQPAPASPAQVQPPPTPKLMLIQFTQDKVNPMESTTSCSAVFKMAPKVLTSHPQPTVRTASPGCAVVAATSIKTPTGASVIRVASPSSSSPSLIKNSPTFTGTSKVTLPPATHRITIPSVRPAKSLPGTNLSSKLTNASLARNVDAVPTVSRKILPPHSTKTVVRVSAPNDSSTKPSKSSSKTLPTFSTNVPKAAVIVAGTSTYSGRIQSPIANSSVILNQGKFRQAFTVQTKPAGLSPGFIIGNQGVPINIATFQQIPPAVKSGTSTNVIDLAGDEPEINSDLPVTVTTTAPSVSTATSCLVSAPIILQTPKPPGIGSTLPQDSENGASSRSIISVPRLRIATQIAQPTLKRKSLPESSPLKDGHKRQKVATSEDLTAVNFTLQKYAVSEAKHSVVLTSCSTHVTTVSPMSAKPDKSVLCQPSVVNMSVTPCDVTSTVERLLSDENVADLLPDLGQNLASTCKSSKENGSILQEKNLRDGDTKASSSSLSIAPILLDNNVRVSKKISRAASPSRKVINSVLKIPRVSVNVFVKNAAGEREKCSVAEKFDNFVTISCGDDKVTVRSECGKGESSLKTNRKPGLNVPKCCTTRSVEEVVESDSDDEVVMISCHKNRSLVNIKGGISSDLGSEGEEEEENNLRCNEEFPDDDSPNKLRDSIEDQHLNVKKESGSLELQPKTAKTDLKQSKEDHDLKVEFQKHLEELLGSFTRNEFLPPVAVKDAMSLVQLQNFDIEKVYREQPEKFLENFKKCLVNFDQLNLGGLTHILQANGITQQDFLCEYDKQLNNLFKNNLALIESTKSSGLDAKKTTFLERLQAVCGSEIDPTGGCEKVDVGDITVIDIGKKQASSKVAAMDDRKPDLKLEPKTEPCGDDSDSEVQILVEQDIDERSRICVCLICGSFGLEKDFMRGGLYCSPGCCKTGHEQAEAEEKARKNRTMSSSENKVRVKSFVSQVNELKTSEKVSAASTPSVTGQKGVFSWVKYLEHCQKSLGARSKAAPLKLWPEPFPCSKNLFKTGMKLEGVDPEHQSLYCVLTVVDVMGHRVKLHFDGYSDVHDFWTYADSPLLFNCGWCERNGRLLSPPPGTSRFSWKGYLEHCSATAAPKLAFRMHGAVPATSYFRPGMKLEAEDRSNGWMCVATVTDVVRDRILVHFDGWDAGFDFWTESSSPLVRPVGWSAANKIHLYAPKDYPNPDTFNWHEYLEQTGSIAAPARAFKTRPSRGFKPNMKLEVVDKRNPVFVRVATIVDVQDYQVKVHFDDWDSAYDYWIDDDSPDLHPPSWCSKTGHILQPPLEFESPEAFSSGCGVTGCKGYGHIKGPIYSTHHNIFGCPYSPQHINKEPDFLIPDRIVVDPEKKNRKLANKNTLLDLGGACSNDDEDDSLKKRVRKRRRFFDEIPDPAANPNKICKFSIDNESNGTDARGMVDPDIVLVTTKKSAVKAEQLNADSEVHQSVFSSNSVTMSVQNSPFSWKQFAHLYQCYNDVDDDKVALWSPEEVEEHLCQLPGCSDINKVFVRENIDGAALLLLTQSDLVKLLNVKLGHALKVAAFVDSLRQRHRLT